MGASIPFQGDIFSMFRKECFGVLIKEDFVEEDDSRENNAAQNERRQAPNLYVLEHKKPRSNRFEGLFETYELDHPDRFEFEPHTFRYADPATARRRRRPLKTGKKSADTFRAVWSPTYALSMGTITVGLDGRAKRGDEIGLRFVWTTGQPGTFITAEVKCPDGYIIKKDLELCRSRYSVFFRHITRESTDPGNLQFHCCSGQSNRQRGNTSPEVLTEEYPCVSERLTVQETTQAIPISPLVNDRRSDADREKSIDSEDHFIETQPRTPNQGGRQSIEDRQENSSMERPEIPDTPSCMSARRACHARSEPDEPVTPSPRQCKRRKFDESAPSTPESQQCLGGIASASGSPHRPNKGSASPEMGSASARVDIMDGRSRDDETRGDPQTVDIGVPSFNHVSRQAEEGIQHRRRSQSWGAERTTPPKMNRAWASDSGLSPQATEAVERQQAQEVPQNFKEHHL